MPVASLATHLALLRGINVGTAKRVPMAELKGALEDLGATGVRTLLNSGNVVFGAKGRGPTAERIRAAVRARTGVDARVTVLKAADWRAIVAGNTIAQRCDNPSRMLVAVLAEAADLPRAQALVDKHQPAAGSREAVAVGPRALYLWCPDGLLDSPLAEALLGPALKDAVTSRNWGTALKLMAMLDD